jgi:catechol 2,3-dioxygenase-like lactoylglutathione lyase family enzyme
MINHVSIGVRNLAATKRFYDGRCGRSATRA